MDFKSVPLLSKLALIKSSELSPNFYEESDIYFF